MGLLDRDQIVRALERLGQIALTEGATLEIIVAGGAAMVLGYNARQSTHDVDALVLPPPDPASVRRWAEVVANEFAWPADWLNDAVKGYFVGISSGPTLLTAPGIQVRQPSVEQLLAMKLCAWRDDVDISDAARLLSELDPHLGREVIWTQLLPFILPGRELKARYAFEDLWTQLHVNH